MTKKMKTITQKEAVGTFLTHLENDEYTDADEILNSIVNAKVRKKVAAKKRELFEPTSK